MDEAVFFGQGNMMITYSLYSQSLGVLNQYAALWPSVIQALVYMLLSIVNMVCYWRRNGLGRTIDWGRAMMKKQ